MSYPSSRSMRIALADVSAIILLLTCACTTWDIREAPSPTEAQKAPLARYRITTRTQREIYLMQVHYRNDSILGLNPDDPRAKETGVAKSEVAAVEKQVSNFVVLALITVGLVVGFLRLASQFPMR